MSPNLKPRITDLPLPIRTPRLVLRTKQPGDGAIAAAAVAETWDDLHRWMQWAENLEDLTAERMDLRNRQLVAGFPHSGVLELLGIESATGHAVVWCGLHDIDWSARRCDTGFWVRGSAHGRGFATEAANALIRYAFGALGMRRVGLTHSGGNEASRRVAEKLGFTPQEIIPAATSLPGGRVADRHCYALVDTAALPPLPVQWGE